MARPRTLPDSDVFAAILHRIATEGEKAVSFASIARATGLAGASLVQRYGGLPQMVEQALVWGWDQLEARATAAEVAAHDKGPQALLKALGDGGPNLPIAAPPMAALPMAAPSMAAPPMAALPMAALLTASLRSARLRARAAGWRAKVEAMLTARLPDPERAAILFAAWQGQLLWEAAGDKGFRLKDALKRLS